jgi:hypothetical protein
MRLIAVTILLLMFGTIASAGLWFGGVEATVDTFTDVTLFCSFEDNIMSSSEYTQGDYSITLSDGATISDTAEKYGSYGLLCDANWERASLTSEDIVNGTKGRCGFWVYYAATLASGTGLFKLSGSGVYFELESNENGVLITTWADGTNTRTQNGSTGDIQISTWHFIEVEWDADTDTIKVWVDNSLKVSETESILPFTADTVTFGRFDGSGGTIYIDNAMISDLSSARNFYTDTYNGTALKDLTSTPRLDSRGVLGVRDWTETQQTYYGDSIAGIADTPANVGTVSYFHCKASWVATGTIVVGLYDSGNNLVAHGDYAYTHASDPEIINIPLDSSYTLTNQTYYLAVSMPSDTDWAMVSVAIGETNSKYIDTSTGWTHPPASTFEGFDGDKDTRYIIAWLDDLATTL